MSADRFRERPSVDDNGNAELETFAGERVLPGSLADLLGCQYFKENDRVMRFGPKGGTEKVLSDRDLDHIELILTSAAPESVAESLMDGLLDARLINYLCSRKEVKIIAIKDFFVQVLRALINRLDSAEKKSVLVEIKKKLGLSESSMIAIGDGNYGNLSDSEINGLATALIVAVDVIRTLRSIRSLDGK